jgi:flagellar hook protein FlgE
MITGVQTSRILGMFSETLDGMRRSQRRLEESAGEIAKGDLSPDKVVSMIEAEHAFKANAAVARTTDRMIGTILDARA